MKKFIVIDKELGISWINDNIEEVVRSVGHEGETWDNIKEKVAEVYEVIEVNGTCEYILG
jgi:hypothetical protein